jgi:hypothetical protein
MQEYYCKYLKIELQINKLQKSVMLTKIAPQLVLTIHIACIDTPGNKIASRLEKSISTLAFSFVIHS